MRFIHTLLFIISDILRYNREMNSSNKMPKKGSASGNFNFLSDSQKSGDSSLTVSPVLEILRQIYHITKSDAAHEGKILFRGQKSKEWDLKTSAHIRLERETKREVSEEEELYYNLELIEQFKHADFNSGHSSEIMKGDLGILAELQHQGAATSLIDFSDNPLIALWFACQKSPELNKKNSKDGKVLILSTANKSKFREMDNLEHTKDYSTILNDETLYYWKLAHLNKRITAQQSYFLIGKRIPPKMKEMQEIPIEENLKSKILEDLSSVYGINEITLFPDLVGFAQANSIDSTYGKEKERLRNRIIILHHDKIIETNPKNLQAYNKRGIAKYNLGEYQKALRDYDEAIKIYPNYENAYYHRGNAQYKLGNYQFAINDFNEAIDINDQNEDAYYHRGNANYELKEYQKAIDDFTKAIKLKPKKMGAYYNRGIAKIELKEYQKAIDDFTKVIKIDQNHEDAYYHRGNAKIGLKDYNGAIEDYNKAINIDPGRASLYNNRGNAKIELNKYKEAIEDYNKAIEINPNNTNAYYNRGNARYKLKDYKRALDNYTQVINIDPNNTDAYNNSGIAKCELNDYKKGIVYFTQAIKIDQKNTNPYYNRSIAKRELKDYKGAINDLTQVIGINPKHANAYNSIGYIKYKLKKYKKSIEDFTQAINIDPKNANAYHNRGRAKYELKEYQNAIDDYSKAIKINPNIAQFHINRGLATSDFGLAKHKLKDDKGGNNYLKEGINDYKAALKVSKDKDVTEIITKLLKNAKKMLKLFQSKPSKKKK